MVVTQSPDNVPLYATNLPEIRTTPGQQSTRSTRFILYKLGCPTGSNDLPGYKVGLMSSCSDIAVVPSEFHTGLDNTPFAEGV